MIDLKIMIEDRVIEIELPMVKDLKIILVEIALVVVKVAMEKIDFLIRIKILTLDMRKDGIRLTDPSLPFFYADGTFYV